MKNKFLALALVLCLCFMQKSLASTQGQKDPIVNLNAVKDGKKTLYCEPDSEVSSCFVFTKIKNNVVGLFFVPGNHEEYTCFYGQISKKYSNILVGTGYELATYDELFNRNSFKPSIQSDDLNFNYKNFIINKTRKKVKFIGATINFDAIENPLQETLSGSDLYKKYDLKNQTPDPSICSKIKF